jgi:hypothetical protein
MLSLQAWFRRRAVVGSFATAVLLLVVAHTARSAQRDPLLDGWQGQEQPLPEAARVDPEQDDRNWLQRMTPPAPRFGFPSPVSLWEKMNRGTRKAWTTTRRVVSAPWQRLRGNDRQETASEASEGSGLFSWRRGDPEDRQTETLTDWLAQPRPGS